MTKLGVGDGGYAHKVHEGTQRYLQDLLAQNEKLRQLVVCLQAERLRLDERLVELETSGRRFSEQYVEVERQNTNLVSLYVASYRLHSTLDRGEVLEAIREIIANLVGAEEIAIFQAEGATLRLAASFGIDPAPYRVVAVGAGPIGRAASTGELYMADADTRLRDASPDGAAVTACIPLVLAGEVTGAIAIFRLLPQKPSFEAVDRELFEMLATHAAMALYATALSAAASASAGAGRLGAAS